MKGSARVLQMADGLRSIEGRISRPSITGPGNLTDRSPGGSFLLPYLRRSQLPRPAGDVLGRRVLLRRNEPSPHALAIRTDPQPRDAG
jgi:hypothetical protein